MENKKRIMAGGLPDHIGDESRPADKTGVYTAVGLQESIGDKKPKPTSFSDKAILRAKYLINNPIEGIKETLKDIHWGHSDNVLDMISESDPNFAKMYKEAFEKDLKNLFNPFKNFKESQERKQEMIDSLNNHRPSGWYYQGD